MRLEWALGLAALTLATPAAGQTFGAVPDGDGFWGTPYGALGPLQTHAWEEYRKDANNPGLYPVVAVTDLGQGRVRYDPVRHWVGPAPSGAADISVTPGVFFATSRSLRSPPEARLQLPPSGATVDLRLGFVEHLATGGGAPLNVWVTRHGGDNGPLMDPYFGGWGVDGLFIEVELTSSDGPTWLLHHIGLQLKAADSGETQQHTVDDQLVINAPLINAPELGPVVYDLGTLASQPLSLSWELDPAGDGASVNGELGGVAFSWLFDNGTSRRGLTDPAQPDGVGYQGGGLDLSSLVPMLYLGIADEGIGPANTPPQSLQLDVLGSAPQLAGVPDSVAAGETVGFEVTARDQNGNVDPTYPQTVLFTSSDPQAELPPAYTFTPQDQGTHPFQLAFRSPGTQSVQVADAEIAGLATQKTGIRVRSSLSVGCGCVGAPSGGPQAAELWLFMLFTAGTATAAARRAGPWHA